jgi:hypothetical protein
MFVSFRVHGSDDGRMNNRTFFYNWSLCSYDLFSVQWASGHNLYKKNMFPMKMTLLRYVTVLIRFITLPSLFLYISYSILCHLCVPGDVCMLFVLTPVLLYMWNKRPPFILHCVTCPFLCIQISVVQKNVT